MLPTLAITSGEAAGIGPELTVKLAQKSWPARLLFISNVELLKETAKRLNLPLEVIHWDQHSNIPEHEAGKIFCLSKALKATVTPGVLDKQNAPYVISTLQKASDLCLKKIVQGVVTGPVHKGIINDAGIPFTGHTEFFADNAKVDRVVMLLATTAMRVALVTTHLPLSEVSAAITQSSLQRTLEIVHHELKSRFQISHPELLVLGLNPHAGEGGHMGDEEIKTITPVIQRLQQQGFKITGPVSADTAFGNHQHPAKTDVIIAMYHDQGLPVLKYRGFGHAINITLGLPYIRTSVDHGTALDLAGKNLASSSSFEYAIEQAIIMSTL